MIETVHPFGPLRHRTKWFAPQLRWQDSLRFVTYEQSPVSGFQLGFVQQPFHTKVLDLTVSEDVIFSGFSKNTQAKIRRAQRDRVDCTFSDDPIMFHWFRSMYNKYAKLQGRGQIPAYHTSHVCCSYAATLDNGVVLALHCTLVDPQLQRARLWYSCSCYRPDDPSELRNLIGRANRLLHFEDLRHFKTKGTALYDFGGYSADTNDRKKMDINKFKDGFGGELMTEANYISLPLFIMHQGVLLGNWMLKSPWR
jgi:hypothetical protein